MAKSTQAKPRQNCTDVRDAKIMATTPRTANSAWRWTSVYAEPNTRKLSMLEADSTMIRPSTSRSSVAPSSR